MKLQRDNAFWNHSAGKGCFSGIRWREKYNHLYVFCSPLMLLTVSTREKGSKVNKNYVKLFYTFSVPGSLTSQPPRIHITELSPKLIMITFCVLYYYPTETNKMLFINPNLLSPGSFYSSISAYYFHLSMVISTFHVKISLFIIDW